MIEPEVIGQDAIVLFHVPRGTLNQAPFAGTVAKGSGCIHHSLPSVHAVKKLVHGFTFKDAVTIANYGERNLHALRRNANQTLLTRQRKPANDHRHLKDVSVAYALGKYPQGA